MPHSQLNQRFKLLLLAERFLLGWFCNISSFSSLRCFTRRKQILSAMATAQESESLQRRRPSTLTAGRASLPFNKAGFSVGGLVVDVNIWTLTLSAAQLKYVAIVWSSVWIDLCVQVSSCFLSIHPSVTFDLHRAASILKQIKAIFTRTLRVPLLFLQ